MKIRIIEVGLDDLIVETEDGEQYIVDTSGCWRCDKEEGCLASIEGMEMDKWYEVDVICFYDFYAPIYLVRENESDEYE